MKKLILSILILFAGTTLLARATHDSAKRKKFEELRNTILSETLSLSKEEQKSFLPIYNEYKHKEHRIMKQIRKTTRSANNAKLTDAEATRLLDKLKQLHRQKARLFTTYSDKFKTVLPVQKVVKLYAVEKEIRRILLNKLKDRRGKSKCKLCNLH